MRKLILLALFFSMVSVALGEVSARVCLADGNTPWEPQDIMVGTRLTIIVDSNVAEYWGGSLVIEDEHRNYGELSARGSEPNYPGSCFEAAGFHAAVHDWEESGVDGFDLYTGYSDIEIGDWFIIDYNAINIGDCNVGFYRHNIPFENELICYLEFMHVRTRDFDKSTKVDFADFAVFTTYWRGPDCNDPNWCEGTDLDTDGTVDVNDLMLFSDYWLVRTE